MKYVMLQSRDTDGEGGLAQPMLFTAPMTHAQVADAFKATHRVGSAGFCEVGLDGRFSVFGRSDSLNLEPATGDGELITAFAKHTLEMGRSLFLPAPIRVKLVEASGSVKGLDS